mmetsp:Transcript_3436/g.6029  ORF Transcript_3436/g.6029 Transcript_3436/m.6029 type:complete len:121 (-) Transcript_3436:310-672(-)
MQIINDFPYTGIDIWATVRDCEELTWKEGEAYNTTLEDCAADILAVFADFVNLATDLAVILATCPEEKYRKSPCVALSSDISSNVFALGAWALTVKHSCDNEHDELKDYFEQSLPLTELS